MNEKNTQLIATFEARVRHLIFLHETLQKENAVLRQQLADKEMAMNEVEQRVKDWQQKYQVLQTAQALTLPDKDLADTKKRVSGLIKEVNQCIALLKS